MGLNLEALLSKEEIIEKLEEISNRYDEMVTIEKAIQEYEPEDNYPRQTVLEQFPGEYDSDEEREELKASVDHTATNAVELMTEIHHANYHPRKPKEPKIEPHNPPYDKAGEVEKVKSKSGFLVVGALVLGIPSLFLFPDLVSWLGLGGFGIMVASFFIKLQAAKAKDQNTLAQAKAEYDQRVQAILDEYDMSQKIYNWSCNEYEKSFQSFIAQYKTWRTTYLQYCNEEKEIEKKLLADKESGLKQLRIKKMVAKNILETTNTLVPVPEEYLPALPKIIELIRMNRADNLKEAINLYEEIAHRERELELQKEQERHRQLDESIRSKERMILELLEKRQRHADEERRHREKMDLLKEQERQRRADEEQRYRQEKRDREAREAQERRAARASRQKRCPACAYNTQCTIRFGEGAYDCTGFKPR